MATASLRAYLQGPNTLPMRRRIVMAYLNTVPLAAAPRFGEVHGIGDGLWAWYGIDFATLNQTLSRPPRQDDPEYASALKHALSLIVSVRRPSYYLATNRKALDALTDDHLELLAGAGVIPRELAERAKQVKLRGPADRVDPPPPRFVEQKAANAQRNRLASLLGIPQLYDLDRLDLQALTTINQAAQKQVGAFLQGLDKPEAVAAAGLIGYRLLKPDNDFSKVIYSFSLYERTPTGIHLRVQADNLNQPFDINSQARLDLGSTAKLRTLVTYLEIISRLHADYRTLDKAALQQKAQPQRDVLSQWVATILLDHPEIELADLLNGAMSRQNASKPHSSRKPIDLIA
jgi:membrane peptidoglycan carboxypeptidase